MQAGRLRRKITIQQQSITQDAVGQPVDTWSDVASVWAGVEDISATETVRDGAFSAQVTTRVETRYRTGITAGMRITYDGRTLEIVAPPIDSEGRTRRLEILCKEVTP